MKYDIFSGRLLLLCFFSLVMFFSHVDTARAQCGFDELGDYTCGQAGGGGAPGPGPGAIGGGYNGADYLSDVILPSLDSSCSATAALTAILPLLPPSIQSALTVQLMNFVGTASCADISDLLTQMIFFQEMLEGLPLNPCSGGAGGGGAAADVTGNDVTQESIFAYMINMLGIDLAFGGSTIPLNVDMGTLLADACSAHQPPCTPTGAPAGGGGGGGTPASCTPVNNATIEHDIMEHLKLREGVRNCAYQDSLGHWTIGVGHLITDSDPYVRSTSTCISDAEVDTLLANDMGWAVSAAQSQMAELGVNCHDFLVALVSVNYQMGAGWRNKFPSTWSLMRQGRYSDAAAGLESSLWNSQTPVRVADFQNALNALEGGAPASPGGGCAAGGGVGGGGAGGGGAGGGGGSPPPTDPLGSWCPDANAAGYATDANLPGTYNLSSTDPGALIAESAMLSIGATTGDADDVTSPSSGTRGGLGCALAVSRILQCSGIADFPRIIGTDALYDHLEGDSCYELVDTGSLEASGLQPGDILVTGRNFSTGRAGHTGIYIGNNDIISNSSSGFAGSNGQSAGGVMQNYTVDSWNSSVIPRNVGKSGVFRRTCAI